MSSKKFLIVPTSLIKRTVQKGWNRKTSICNFEPKKCVFLGEI